jgi:chromosome segregation ATPase
LLLAALYVNNAGAQVNEAVSADIQVNEAAARSQEQVDAQQTAREDAANQYQQYVREADSYERFNERLAERIRSQEEELASIEEQLAGIETTTREIEPLMETMVASLKQFVSLDLPFMIEDRTTAVEELESVLARSDVDIAEKYRVILERYQIELDYGRTLGWYEGYLGSGDNRRAVTFVRLGRVALMYRNEDGSEVGYWDRNQGDWVVANEYLEEVEEALRVAREEGAPDLLLVPVPAPTPAFQESQP